MTHRLISPTERDLPRYLSGKSSLLPERKYGADVLSYVGNGSKLAVQRKSFPIDFLASIRDGRLARELPLLRQAEYPIIALEGTPFLSYTADGNLMMSYQTHWNKKGIRNAIRSLFVNHGCWVEWTKNTEDTADVIMEWEEYLSGAEHFSLLVRPKSGIKNGFNEKDKESSDLFLLQGFDGIGFKLASKIYDSCGKRIPLKWDISKEELVKIIGKPKIAEKIWRQINAR